MKVVGGPMDGGIHEAADNCVPLEGDEFVYEFGEFKHRYEVQEGQWVYRGAEPLTFKSKIRKKGVGGGSPS
ncbi:MAG: hypothetical protein B7733_13070 [Myxococcales bacterium FL481]|nr:MAG: hypothetical protein B7733_13070 [Myxococcales bacterium FL481]